MANWRQSVIQLSNLWAAGGRLQRMRIDSLVIAFQFCIYIGAVQRHLAVAIYWTDSTPLPTLILPPPVNQSMCIFSSLFLAHDKHIIIIYTRGASVQLWYTFEWARKLYNWSFTSCMTRAAAGCAPSRDLRAFELLVIFPTVTGLSHSCARGVREVLIDLQTPLFLSLWQDSGTRTWKWVHACRSLHEEESLATSTTIMG